MQVQLLGPVRVVDDDGREVPIGGNQPRRIVAALAAEHGAVVSVGHLIDVVWDAGAPPDAQANLQTYVSRLRRAIGRDSITTAPDGYRFDPSTVGLDIDRFDRLLTEARSTDPGRTVELCDAALGLSRGAILGSLADEWWARPLVHRIEERWIEAQLVRIDALVVLDRRSHAAAAAERLHAAHRLREPVVRRYVTALHRLGRSSEALTVAAGFRRALSDSSGLEPSPALVELEQAILQHRPSSPAPLTSLRGYGIIDTVAIDRFGTLYRGLDERSQPVVIRAFASDVADDERFVREFETVGARLRSFEHPCVAGLLDYWREPGAAYAVYDVALRGSVEALGAAGTLPGEVAGTIAERIGAALGAFEGHALRHGNVSAASVLIDTAGQPVLCDPAWWALDASTPETGADLSDADALTAVVERVRTWVGSRPEPASNDRSGIDRSTAANPYPGLRPFGEADHARFYGRSEVVELLDTTVGRHRWVTVVGPSGVGKSSVVVAGLVPVLRRHGWLVSTMLPGPDPVEALRRALLRIATAPQSSNADDERVLLGAVSREHDVVLVVDQLEELWTVAPPAERERFIDALVSGVTDATSRLRVVSTIRADFFDRPLSDPRLGSLVGAATVPIAPLDQVELEQVVVRPLDGTGVRLADGLPTRIVRDAGRAGALPLLQFALHTLFETRRRDVLSHEDYDRLGAIAGAVSNIAERWFAALDVADQRRAPAVLGALVVPGIGSDDTRRTARLNEFGAEDRALLDSLASARLLTVDRDRGSGESVVTLAHESLVHHWPRLQGWIDDDRAALLALRTVADAAQTWEGSGREESHLFRGSRLALFDDIDQLSLGPVVREFATASLEAAAHQRRRERRRLRRTQMVAGALALALMAAAVGIGVAVQQGRRADDNAARAAELAETADANAQQADANASAASAAADRATTAAADAELARAEAEISRIAALAPRLADSDPDLGVLLAADVAQRRPNTETYGSLLAALQTRPEIDRYIDLGLDESETLLGVGPVGGDTIVLTTDDEVLIADAGCLCPTGARWNRGDAGTLALNPTGTELLTVSRAGVAQRHDVATTNRVGPAVEVTPATIYCCGPPAAYLDDDRTAIADGSVIEVYARGAEVPLERIDIGFPIGLLSVRPGTTELFVAADVAAGGSASMVIDLATGARRDLAPTTTAAQYRSDGSQLLVLRGYQTVTFERLDAATLEVIGSVDLATSFGIGITELADGSALIRGADQSNFAVAADMGSATDVPDAPGAGVLVAMPDGSALGVLGNRMLVVDPAAAQPVVTSTPHVGAALLSEDGSTLVVSGPDGLQGFTLATGRPVGPVLPTLANLEITSFAVAPDGSAVLASIPGGGAAAFALATGDQMGPTLTEASVWGGMQFSHDGSVVAVHVNGGVGVYDTASLRRRDFHALELVSGNYLQFSPDDRELFVQDISTWGHRIDLASGAVTPFSLFAAYERVGDAIVGIGIGEPLRILDRSTGDETLLSAWREIAVPVLLPGTGLLARIRFNDTVDLIDLDSAQRVGDPITIPAGQLALGTVTPDGGRMVLGSRNHPVVIIELDPQRWKEMACERAGRNLTRAEWDRFLGSLGEYRATCPQYPLSSV